MHSIVRIQAENTPINFEKKVRKSSVLQLCSLLFCILGSIRKYAVCKSTFITTDYNFFLKRQLTAISKM